MISSIMCAVGVIVAIERCGGLDLATRVDSARGQLTYEEKKRNNSAKSTRAATLRSRLFHVSNLLFSSSLQSSKALICVSNPLFPSDAGSTH